MRHGSLFCFLFFMFLILVFEHGHAATTSHVYDDLNRLIRTDYDTGFKITTIIYSYDAAGNMLTHTVTADHLLGDVNNSQTLDLADAVLCLQVMSGVSPVSQIHRAADIDGDNRINLPETIYILRKLAGL